MSRNLKGFIFFLLLFNILNADENKNESEDALEEKDGTTIKLELSYINTSGNTNSVSLSSKLETSSKFDDIELKTKASILRAKDNNEKSANKYDIELKYEHMLGEKLYAFLGANYVNDKFSDYHSRLNIGPGFGYKFIDDSKHFLDIQGGFTYSLDKFKNKDKDEYLAPKTELNYRYNINENVEFKQMINYLISMSDSKKYFITSETGINVKIIEELSLGISYKIDYINYTEKNRTDKQFLTSIIYEF